MHMGGAGDFLFLTAAFLFLGSCVVTIACGLVFDFWAPRHHRKATGRELIQPTVPFPLLSGFYCGMALIAPQRSHGYESSIHLAGGGWRWLARINVGAVVLTIIAGVLMFLMMPGGDL